ncbi:hypothetical protein ACWIG5_38760, partial [Streptomyces lydicus]
LPGADRIAGVHTLRTLDERGVLHAVASRGDHATATALMEARLTYDYATFADYGDAVGVHFLEVNVLDIKWH